MVVSLLDARRELARRPGLGFFLGVAGWQQFPPGGVYAGNAIGNARLLASSDLAELDLTGSDTDTGTDWWDQGWIYLLTNPPEQRRIAAGSYTPNVVASTVLSAGSGTDIVGTIVPTRPFGAVVPAGTMFELHSRAGAISTNDGRTGLRHWINRALGMQKMTVRVPLVGVPGQYRYRLDTLTWIVSGTQLAAVYGPETVANADSFNQLAADLRFDGGVPYLRLVSPVPTAGTFYADFYRPRNSYLRVPIETGTTSAATVDVIGDNSKIWTVNQHVNRRVVLTNGQAYGLARTIISNTSNTLTVSPPWGTDTGPLAAGSTTYAILDWRDSLVGLQGDFDEAAADLYPTVAIAYAYLCDQLATDDPRGESKVWAARRDRAITAAGAFLRNQQEREPVNRYRGRATGDSPQFLRQREGGPYWGRGMTRPNRRWR